MYILLRVKDDSLLSKVRTYLKRLWVREFNEPEYRVDVTAEERARLVRPMSSERLNPKRAWETCASFVEAWDWDSMGRGPSPKTEYELKKSGRNTAPRGKGWLKIDGRRVRVAGECANPTMLNDISCPMWCTKYEPTSIEAHIYVAEQVALEHERRAEALRRQIEFLRQTDKGYREVIRTGGVFGYRDSQFVVTDPRTRG